MCFLLINTILCAAKDCDVMSESTSDLNRGRRIQSVEEDKASLAETFNQKETAACGYEFNNNIVRGKSDLVCRIEEDESDVLKQGLSSESRSTENAKKKLVSKATGDSAQNTVGSSYEMKEGINSSKGTCCEAK